MKRRTRAILIPLTALLLFLAALVPLSKAQVAMSTKGALLLQKSALLLPRKVLSLPRGVVGRAVLRSSVMAAAQSQDQNGPPPDIVQMVGPVSQDLDLRKLPEIPARTPLIQQRLTRHPPRTGPGPEAEEPPVPVTETSAPANIPSPSQTFEGMDSNLSGCACLPPGHGRRRGTQQLHSVGQLLDPCPRQERQRSDLPDFLQRPLLRDGHQHALRRQSERRRRLSVMTASLCDRLFTGGLDAYNVIWTTGTSGTPGYSSIKFHSPRSPPSRMGPRSSASW